MTIAVRCRCGKKYQVGDDKAGKKLRCKACDSILSIPVPEVAAGDPWDDLDENEFDDIGQDFESPAPRKKSKSGKSKKRGKARKSKNSSKGMIPAVKYGIAGGIVVVTVGVVLGILYSRGILGGESGKAKSDGDGGNANVASNSTGNGTSGNSTKKRSVKSSAQNNSKPKKRKPPAEKRPEDYPVLLTNASVQRLSSNTVAVNFDYRFQNKSRRKFISFSMYVQVHPGNRAVRLTVTELKEESGQFRKIFRLDAPTGRGPKETFRINLRGSMRGDSSIGTMIAATASGDVTASKGVAIERTAFEFDREYNSVYTNTTTGQSGRVQDLRGVVIKIHGRIKKVEQNTVEFYGAHSRQIRCLLAEPPPKKVEPGNDVVIVGKVGENGLKMLTFSDCKVVGGAAECKLRRIKVRSTDVALSRLRGIIGHFKTYGRYSNAIFEVTGPVVRASDYSVILKGVDEGHVRIPMARQKPRPELKVGTIATLDFVIGNGFRTGGTVVKTNVKGDPAEYEDPKTEVAPDLLKRISPDRPAGLQKRVRVIGVVAKQNSETEIVLNGNNQQTIVCRFREAAKMGVDKIQFVRGDTYVVDGVVDARTSESLTLTKCWIPHKMVNAEELARAFASNQQSALARFKIQRLRVSGRVHSTRLTRYSSVAYVLLVGAQNRIVSCHVSEIDVAKRVKSLKRGQQVVLQGDCQGLNNEGQVRLSRSRLIRPK